MATKTKRAKQKRRIGSMPIFLVLAALLLLVSVAVYTSYDRPKLEYGQASNLPKPPAPVEFCSELGKACLTAPAGWINMAIDKEATHMQLRNRNDTVQIIFSHDLRTKKSSCPPGECLLSVVSIESFSGLPDTVLIKGVVQNTTQGANVPSEFLLAAGKAADLRAGQSTDTRAQDIPTFNRTIGGKTYVDQLEGTSFSPGNYASAAEAQKWFDTDEGKSVDAVIRSFKQ